MTTHYLEEAEELADRIAVLCRGRLVALESRDEMLARDPGRSLEDIFVDLIRSEARS